MSRITLQTPVGELLYPYLDRPDTKFESKGNGGHYRAKLRVAEDDPELAKFQAQLREVFQNYVDELAPKVSKRIDDGNLFTAIKPAADWDKESQTEVPVDGFVDITTKQVAKLVLQDGVVEMSIAIRDAKNNDIKGKVRVGSGTLARLAVSPNPFGPGEMGSGVSLRLQGVQVIKLVEMSGGADNLFDTMENDGYVWEDSSEDIVQSGEVSEAAKGGDF